MDGQESSTNVSRNVIYVLVVLTLLVSILGTWTVLSQVSAGRSAPPVRSDSGEVQFALVDPAPAAPIESTATGNVVLNLE